MPLPELKPGPQGTTLLRNGKPVLTPARRELRLPTDALAQAVAQEWANLGDEKINPLQLPLTGFAALALDVIEPQRPHIVEELLDYGETDLLLYRESEDFALRRRQDRLWQHWLEWGVQRYGTAYQVAYGITPVAQESRNRSLYQEAMHSLDIWQLAGLAVVVKCTGSLLLGLAFIAGAIDAQDLFDLSRLEEAHNIERWGEDAEAAGRAAQTLTELQNAQKWRDLLLTESAEAAR